jgi:hypothetical protein
MRTCGFSQVRFFIDFEAFLIFLLSVNCLFETGRILCAAMLYPAKKNRTVSTPLLRKIVAVLIGFLGFTSSREQRSQGIFQFQRLPKLLNQSHQIQAFEHRVDSAEEAHEIGMQLAKKYWVASMSLYLVLILTRDIFTSI